MGINLQEIGNTPLIHARKLGELLGLPRIYIKTENKNPTRTQKDRAALALVIDALERGYAELTIGTCGNFGASLAAICGAHNIRCTVFMPERYQGVRGEEMERDGAIIVYTKEGYEGAVAESSIHARRNKIYDANPTSPRAALASLRAYSEIAFEISRTIPSSDLESVWVAVGNGTTLAGIYNGFYQLGSEPIFGAVSSKGNNAILASFEEKRAVELDPETLTETHVNEPLLNYRAFHVNEVLRALGDTGRVYGATDIEMLHAAEMLYTEESIITQPASASVLFGLIAHKNSLQKNKSHVLILTS